jgi:hypothetical protein
MNRTFQYHAQPRPRPSYDQKTGKIPLIGFEIEKQDEDARGQDSAQEILDRYFWIKERDGSLCSHTGFELVSPVYCLNENFANIFKPMEYLINAATDNKGNKPTDADEDENLHDSDRNRYDVNQAPRSKNCGGHINISHPKFGDSYKLAQALENYYPLFYAMYKGRINNRYTEAKNKKTKKENRHNKYSAFHCKENGVFEIRIFSAVKNVNQLLWRIELIRWMLEHPYRSAASIIGHIINPKSPLNALLNKVYTPEGIHNLAVSYCNHSEAYNNKKPLNNPDQEVKEMFNRLRNSYKTLNIKDKNQI